MPLEHGGRPLPDAPVVALPTIAGATSCRRDRVPVSEADIGAALVATLELVQEHAELRLGGDPPALNAGVH